MYANGSNLVKDTAAGATLLVVAMAWVVLAALQGPLPAASVQAAVTAAAERAVHDAPSADLAASHARPAV